MRSTYSRTQADLNIRYLHNDRDILPGVARLITIEPVALPYIQLNAMTFLGHHMGQY